MHAHNEDERGSKAIFNLEGEEKGPRDGDAFYASTHAIEKTHKIKRSDNFRCQSTIRRDEATVALAVHVSEQFGLSRATKSLFDICIMNGMISCSVREFFDVSNYKSHECTNG